jgi:opacity protein-like surface antigen
MAAAACCSAAATAEAADMSQPRVVTYAPAEVAVAGGWYLRGDVGAGILTQSSLYESSIANPTAGTKSGWLNQSIETTSTIGAGVGYQFSDNLRGDVTLQYRTATSFQAANYVTNTTTNATGENDIRGTTSSVVGLVNGYYDITHWNGLTPFVGAGIGVAFNKMGAVSTQQGGFTGNEYGVYPTKWSTNFAWALHTGLSYDINPRLKLEMGYSYLNLGNTNAAPLVCYGGANPPTILCGDSLKNKNLASHDFHIGMRWMLDSVATQSASWSSANSWQSSSNYQTQTYQPSSSQTYPSSSQQSYSTYPSYPSSNAPVVAKY